MENDDGKRGAFGVVVSLLPLEDGTTRITLDDVRSADPLRTTTWRFDTFYTHKRLDSSQLEAMTLADSEYEGLGAAVVARLLAMKDTAKKS